MLYSDLWRYVLSVSVNVPQALKSDYAHIFAVADLGFLKGGFHW